MVFPLTTGEDEYSTAAFTIPNDHPSWFDGAGEDYTAFQYESKAIGGQITLVDSGAGAGAGGNYDEIFMGGNEESPLLFASDADLNSDESLFQIS